MGVLCRLQFRAIVGRMTQQTKVGCFFNVVYKVSSPYSRQLWKHGLYESISYTSLLSVCMTHSWAESELVVSSLLQINIFLANLVAFFLLIA